MRLYALNADAPPVRAGRQQRWKRTTSHKDTRNTHHASRITVMEREDVVLETRRAEVVSTICFQPDRSA